MAKKDWSQLTEAQRDKIVRTAISEAGGEGKAGMEAVIQVILNRAESGRYSSDPAEVVLQPGQFSGWNDVTGYNKGIGGNNPNQWAKDSKSYQRAEEALEAVLGGAPDRTGGALMYHTDDIKPYWADDENKHGTIQLGNHVFYAGHKVPPKDIPEGASTGNETEDLQRALKAKGFDPGPVDGIRGPLTREAVKAFQKANGLDVDGIAGPKTWAKLEAGAAAPTTQRAPRPPDWVDVNPLPAPNLLVPQESGLITRKVPRVEIDEESGLPLAQVANALVPSEADLGLGNGVGLFGPGWETLQTLKDISAGKYREPATAPVPRNRPSEAPSAPAAPVEVSPAPVRLASGKMIAPGVYPSSDGRGQVRISDDGSGGAKIERLRGAGIPGVIDIGREMNAPTLAGAFIRGKIAEATQGIEPNALVEPVGTAATRAIESVTGTAAAAQQAGGNALGSAWDSLTSFFGGGPATTPETKMLELVTTRPVKEAEIAGQPAAGPGLAPVPMPGRPMLVQAQVAPRLVTPAPVRRLAAGQQVHGGRTVEDDMAGSATP